MRKLIFAVLAVVAISSSTFAGNKFPFPVPGELKSTADTLKKGTPAYLSFVATRTYIQDCIAHPKNPPNKMPNENPAKFNWDYTTSKEGQIVQDCVVEYFVLHP